MERHGVDERQAFELLRQQARRSNRRVVELAQRGRRGPRASAQPRRVTAAWRSAPAAGSLPPHGGHAQARLQEVPGRRDDGSRGRADVLRDDVAVPGAARRHLAARPARRRVARDRTPSTTRATTERRRRSSTRCESSLSATVENAGGAVSVALVFGIAVALYGAVGRVRRRGPRAQQRLRRQGDAQLHQAQAQRPRLDARRHRPGGRRAVLRLPRRRIWPTTCSARSASATRRPRSGASRGGCRGRARCSASTRSCSPSPRTSTRAGARIITPGAFAGV